MRSKIYKKNGHNHPTLLNDFAVVLCYLHSKTKLIRRFIPNGYDCFHLYITSLQLRLSFHITNSNEQTCQNKVNEIFFEIIIILVQNANVILNELHYICISVPVTFRK